MRVLFFISAAALVYAYFGYPIILWLAGHFWTESAASDSNQPRAWPSVSVIVTVFNEQKAVAKKIDNFLTNGYPGNSEMIVVSDGSTDNTVEIISQFEGPRIRLIENRTRRGKDPTLEDAVRDSTGEILLFTDVGAIFADDALEKLVRPFSDPNLGLVTGVARYLGAESAGLYRRHEDWLKSLEARVGVLSGALGPMFA
ncbi:MAG: glycosyltransferase, partial [Blastocatellia bacterium]